MPGSGLYDQTPLRTWVGSPPPGGGSGGPMRARPMRAQGGPQGPAHKGLAHNGPGRPTRAQWAHKGTAHKGPRRAARAQGNLSLLSLEG